ncbi:glycosyltransferase family 4 protein [Parapedobacter sp. SGR-10]|uniref:glycosyltransferase family 4 protein n=1 Tax=Parapedobacter sp. SGR-10 TaxID=2710879 RepID=UPI0013CF778A|nr:glycosyltransferase family 4 protein [Parapedobacter sp. SGR-10]NGF56307.1 glycosyltransferase family 4 protein [Parapedobacter sp. SGR-10]
MNKEVAIIVQRYGLEVNGGAEYHARLLAEQLSQQYKVQVLTTTALDYGSWANHYSAGVEVINGIHVHRFPTLRTPPRRTRVARRAISKKRKYFKILKRLGVFDFLDKKFNITRVRPQEVENWIIGQGPYCPELIRYIKEHKEQFDAFIFFTYLYYPTFKGMPLVKDKAIFIPTAHDEPLLYTLPYTNIFSVPKFIMYNTESEKKLIESHFKNPTKQSDIAGVGIEKYRGEEGVLPDTLQQKKYFVYIGRIDVHKGCDQMLEYFIQFQDKYPEYKEYKLVLVGKNYMEKSYDHPAIMYTGFIDEGLKYTLLRNARAMIMPSFYESLSLVTLEAMYEEIPVIVNEECEVLYAHIFKSQTGLSYNSPESFFKSLEHYILKSERDLAEEGKKAKQYVSDHYTWKKVLDKFENSIAFVSKT